MKTASLSNAPFVLCPSCVATGRRIGSVCTACKGAYSGVNHNGVFLYWGSSLTGDAIRTRHALARAHPILTMVSLLFGAAMILQLLWGVREMSLDLFDAAFWAMGGVAVFWFWIGVAALLYALMRVMRNAKQRISIPQQAVWEEPSNGRVSESKHNIAASMSDDAVLAIERAYFLAETIHAKEVDRYHVLASLLAFPEVRGIFVRLGVSTNSVQELVAKHAQPNTAQGRLPFYEGGTLAILFLAYISAAQARQEFVGLADLLWSLYHDTAPLQELLHEAGVDARQMDNVIAWVRVRQEIRDASVRRRRAAKRRPKGDTNRAMTALATPYLDSLAYDLTRRAAIGALAPIVGRETELQQMFRALQGGKRSVLLIGEEGVGREAIIEGIALAMVEEQVPPVLADKRLMTLPPSRLLAGATPAEAQERLLHVLYEVRRSGNIILFVPNIESVIGVTEGGAGSLDVAGVLAREMEKGGALLIATTTPESYRRYVANSPIGNAITKIEIAEMSVDQTIRVLEAKAGYIEHEHAVWFSYAAIEQAAMLAAKYMHDDRLPNKAITVVREAAEMARNGRGKDALVSAEDVAQVVSEKSKIPVMAVHEDESEKLLRLEEELHQRVIGQEEAVRAVSSALRRARAQLSSGARTIANFLFLGPTGVGKTELAKTVARVYFGGEQQMIRLDMSEFQDVQSLARLIGQPDVQGSGILTEAIREKPFALLLLDELEKADARVLNLFLQVMDDGRISDSTGATVDCTNIILIATSNAGTTYVQEQIAAGAPYEALQEALLRGKLGEWYRPEFLNRFDAIVLFRALNEREIQQIAGLMISGIAARLEAQGVSLQVDDEALAHLASIGFDPQFGARPMRRVIQNQVENTIAELLLSKRAHRGDRIHFTASGVQVEQQERAEQLSRVVAP